MSQMKLDMVLSYFWSVQYGDLLAHCCDEISVRMSLAKGVLTESIYGENMQENCAG